MASGRWTRLLLLAAALAAAAAATSDSPPARECAAERLTATSVEPCADACDRRGSAYYWCRSGAGWGWGWDYCSPRPRVTYRDQPCRPDHACGSYGHAYTWCYTTADGHWDYCGVVRDCSGARLTRGKRTADILNEDIDGQKVKLVNRGSDKFGKPNDDSKNTAKALITEWDGTLVSGQNVVTIGNVLLDNGEDFEVDGHHFVHLHIEMKGAALGRNKSPTIADVFAPKGTSTNVLRRALRESLNRGVRVEVQLGQ